MQLSMRSVLATGAAAATATAIAFAPPPPSVSVPLHSAAPVVLTSAWDELQANVQQDLAHLQALVTTYPAAPILTQLGKNLTTYSRWLAGQDGGTPLTIVQTVGKHAAAVGTVIVSYSLMAPLSFVGSFIAPGVMILRLIADTAKYPSTPQTVLQAFIDAPAVFLNTAFNCCSSPLFKLAFGLLNPGPLGYMLSLGPAIAKAMEIPPAPAPDSETPVATRKVLPAAAGVAQSGRAQPTATAQKTVASGAAKRPTADRKASARDVTSSPGKGQSARPARAANPGTSR